MALNFNGTSSLAQTTASTNLNFERTTAFSVFGWFNFNIVSGAGQTIIGNLDTTGTFRGWELHINDFAGTKTIEFFLINTYSGNAIQAESDYVPMPKTWAAFGLTYDGSSSGINGVKFYANGFPRKTTIQSAIDTLSATTTNSNQIRLGARANGTEPFLGTMRQLTIWNAKLEPYEQLSLARGAHPKSIRQSRIQGYWPLRGGTPIERDESGNAYDFTTLTNTSATNELLRRSIPRQVLWAQPAPAAGGSFIPAWAMNSNRPVIGTGTY